MMTRFAIGNSAGLRAILLTAMIVQTCATAAHGTVRWEKEGTHLQGVANKTLGASNGLILLLGDEETGSSGLICALSPGSAASADAGRLAVPRSGGASAIDGNDMIYIGGRAAGGASTEVSRLTYDLASASVHETALPPLPIAMERPAAAIVGRRLYVVGCTANDVTGRAFALDLSIAGSTWRSLASPGGSFAPGALVAQSDGSATRPFLIAVDGSGVARMQAYDAKRDAWIARAQAPSSLAGAVAVPSGQAHVMVFGGTANLLYHTITDTWVDLPGVPQAIGQARVVRVGGHTLLVSAQGDVYRGIAQSGGSHFRWPDYLALGGYPVLLIVIGCLLRVKGEANDDDYFRGGKRIPWWAAGLSLVATQVSAIGFVAIPAKTFATDWTYFVGIASWFVVVPVVTHKFIPLYQRMNVTTAYEYLETRFNFAMRLVASLLFMVIQVTRAAVVLYLPAIALSAVTGVDRVWCILGMGLVITVYTVLGGMKTVIWTDVLQAVAMLGGALLCVLIVVFKVGGIGMFVHTAMADHKFAIVGNGWSMSESSLWIVFFGGVFARLASLTSDQNVVQRYQSTANTQQASRALWADVAVSIPWAFIIFLLGTALYVYFKLHPSELDSAMDIDQVVPLFIAERLPVGIAGLAVAAIFAASLEGSMLAVATTFVNDVYGRLRPATSQRRRIRIAQGMTILLGLFSTSIGLLLAVSGIRSLWDFAIQMSGLFTGAVCGVFILGLFFPRVGSAAAMIGLVASGIVMYFVETRSLVHVLFYAGVGICTSVVIALLASLAFPSRSRRQFIISHRPNTLLTASAQG